MRASRSVSLALVVALAHGAAAALAAAPPPMSPAIEHAVTDYLRDPVNGARALLDAARQAPGPLNPSVALLLGDAAMREGSYRSAIEYFTSVRDQDLGPQFTGLAELGLAWSALGRGRPDEARDHFEAAAVADAGNRAVADFASALVDATGGSPDGWQALARAASESTDPSLREVAPLAEAYARYWSGDAEGAIEAFTAFAVAHPDSRFADDALYAAARAKRQAGRTDEATSDLEALAAAPRDQGRTSDRLTRLEGRSMLREGMRRDRDMPTRLVSRRLADLLDGDGVRLAQAALANPGADDDAPARGAGRVAGLSHRHRHGASAASSSLFGQRADAPGSSAIGAPTAPASAPSGGGTHGVAVPVARFPWRPTLAVGALALLVAALALAARRRVGPADR